MIRLRRAGSRQQRRYATAVLLPILLLTAALGSHLWAQESTLPLISAQDANGRVVMPGSSSTLTVLATDRAGSHGRGRRGSRAVHRYCSLTQAEMPLH